MRVLLIGYGNPARGDDGLGPALARRIEKQSISGVTVDADYQLTVEDSHAVAQHDLVVFADSAVNGPAPFYFAPLQPASAISFSSHSVQPAVVLAMAASLFDHAVEGYILGIRGYAFDRFRQTLSTKASENLKQAACFLEPLLRKPASIKDAARQRADAIPKKPNNSNHFCEEQHERR